MPLSCRMKIRVSILKPKPVILLTQPCSLKIFPHNWAKDHHQSKSGMGELHQNINMQLLYTYKIFHILTAAQYVGNILDTCLYLVYAASKQQLYVNTLVQKILYIPPSLVILGGR